MTMLMKTKLNRNCVHTIKTGHILLIIGNVLLNLIENQSDIDKIYFYAKDPYEAKHQYLINNREKVGLKRFNDSKAQKYSNDTCNVYKNINCYKENKVLIVFDDMIADMIHNKKLNSIVTELFIRGSKLNIFLFITQSYFKVPKDVRLNTSHFFISKIPNKRQLRQIAINHSSDISTKNFINIYRKCTAESYSFFVNDTTLAPENPLRFRNLFSIECNSII